MSVFGNFNIIVHGLLFLELKTSPTLTWLEITAPDLSSNHDLLMGVPGNLQNINGETIAWNTLPGLQGGSPGKLIDGIPSDVPDGIFQFTRQEANTGNIDRAGIQGKVLLPWPIHWDIIRKGSRPKLTTRLTSKPVAQQVHTNIENRCNTVIGVATVLSYMFPINMPPIPGWSATSNLHLYFQPKSKETILDVNADLRAASFQLFNSDNFDLAIDSSANTTSTPIGQNSFPPNSGLSICDELSINENVAVVDPKVAGKEVEKSLSVIEDYLILLETELLTGMSPKRQQSVPESKKLSGAESNGEGTPARPLTIFMASPANCPTLYFGGMRV